MIGRRESPRGVGSTAANVFQDRKGFEESPDEDSGSPGPPKARFRARACAHPHHAAFDPIAGSTGLNSSLWQVAKAAE
jgi:hypothetical protein